MAWNVQTMCVFHWKNLKNSYINLLREETGSFVLHYCSVLINPKSLPGLVAPFSIGEPESAAWEFEPLV